MRPRSSRRLNRIRADVDLPALTVNHQLSDLARIHTEHMAAAGEIATRRRSVRGYEGPWAKLGENVEVGAEVEDLVDAFVASPGHYANIVDPAFTEIGVGGRSPQRRAVHDPSVP